MNNEDEFLKHIDVMNSAYMVEILPANSKTRHKVYEHLNSRFVKHFKHHDDLENPFNYIYEIITIGSYSEDHDQKMVVYRSVSDNKVWVRPYEMFFSKVDKTKYPDVKQKYRFESFTLEDYWRCRKNCTQKVIGNDYENRYEEDKKRFIAKGKNGNFLVSTNGIVWNEDRSISTTT